MTIPGLLRTALLLCALPWATACGSDTPAAGADAGQPDASTPSDGALTDAAQDSGGPPTTLCSGGTTRYVLAGATGAGTGLTWTDAYPDLPASLTRGTTYCVGDGSYATHTFADAVSGTTPIVIRKATLADHGTGTGWSDAFGDGTASFPSLAFDTSFYTLDGATGGGPGSWTTKHGFTFTSAAGTNISYVSLFDGMTNFIGRHISCTQTGNTEAFPVGATCFYDAGSLSNSTFEYDHFDNLGALPWLLRTGSGNVFQYNWSGNICGQSVADINQHCEAIVVHGMSDVQFRWNYLSECPSSGGFVFNAGTSDSVRIYGNVFRNGFPIQCNTGTCTNWRVFNNTFATKITGGFIGGDGTRSGILVHDNLTYDASSQQNLGATTHDYNYYSAVTTQCTMNPGAHENICVGCAAGCDSVTATADPFVNEAGTTPEALELAAPIAGQAGTDVCALDACTGEKKYDLDAFGVKRGADGTWDRGAYERP